jgi:hypothetical protein
MLHFCEVYTPAEEITAWYGPGQMPAFCELASLEKVLSLCLFTPKLSLWSIVSANLQRNVTLIRK